MSQNIVVPGTPEFEKYKGALQSTVSELQAQCLAALTDLNKVYSTEARYYQAKHTERLTGSVITSNPPSSSPPVSNSPPAASQSSSSVSSASSASSSVINPQLTGWPQ